MTPFSNGILLDNTNKYGIVKTETVFRLTSAHDSFENDDNSTDPLKWIYSDHKFENGSNQEDLTRSSKDNFLSPSKTSERRSKRLKKELGKKHKKGKGKKKCMVKLFKQGKKSKHKKYLLPLILGLMAAKSVLITIALKALAFISAKGLMMGFFSTILASFLSLKGMFDHSQAWNRRDDTKTQVEIIQVPAKSNDHYDYYKRGDRIPL